MSRIIISIFDHEQNPHYGGGGATVVRHIAEQLAQRHDVTVVSGSFRDCAHLPPAAAGSLVRWRFLPVGWAGPRGGQLLFHLLLPALAGRRDYDLWVESFTPPFSTSFLPLVSGGRPVIGLVQMLAAQGARAPHGRVLRAIERRGLRRYRDFLVLNDVDARIVAEAQPAARCTVMTNGVTLPDVEPLADGSGDHVLFMGRIDVEQKGLDLLLAAYERSGSRLPLVIAGSGRRSEERRLTRLLERCSAPVTWVGHLSGAAQRDMLRTAAFAVLPSRFETFGLAALEAMAYGKPVVHFDLERLRWIPPDAGRAVPAFDVDGLASALRCLSDDREARAALGHTARLTARQHDWERVARGYAQAIDDRLPPASHHEGQPGAAHR